VALCLLLVVFVAAPSTWGGTTVDMTGASGSTSSGAITAPHHLAPTTQLLSAVVRAVTFVLVLAGLCAVVVGCTRRREPRAVKHGRTNVRTWAQRRGPPSISVRAI
jgi:DMSO reductase anchor subunit